VSKTFHYADEFFTRALIRVAGGGAADHQHCMPLFGRRPTTQIYF